MTVISPAAGKIRQACLTTLTIFAAVYVVTVMGRGGESRSEGGREKKRAREEGREGRRAEVRS